MPRKSGVKVAVGVVFDSERRILITQRPLHVSHGGFWEFPGGKLEQDELAEHALIREIKEELGIDIHECQHMGDVHHTYPDKSVQLIVFKVTHFTGTPKCNEGQLDMKWSTINELSSNDFPEANHAILDMIVDQQVEWTGSAEFSDVVLPANMWVEAQDLECGGSCSNPFLQLWGGDGVPPLYDSKDDAAIFAAGALGYGLNVLFLVVEKSLVHWSGK